jgi:hypothetical protein
MSWRHVPPALRIAVVLGLVVVGIRALPPPREFFPLWLQLSMAASAVRYATSVLFAVGALDLSRQLVGGARRGAQIAVVAALLELTVELLWELIRMRTSSPAAFVWVVRYGLSATAVGLVVGFALAARRRFPGLAIAAIVVSVAMRVLVLLVQQREIWVVVTGLHVAILLVLVLVASPEHDVTVPELAERGFRHAARALWLRVAAVGLVPALALVTAGSRATAGIVQTATAGAALISVVSLTYFGIGAIGAARARLAELRAGSLYASGVCALVCAGLTVSQTSFDHNSFGERTPVLSILAPLVAIASLGLLTQAITGFATRRQLHDLRLRGSGSGVMACVLLLVSFVITAWLSSGAASQGSVLLLVLVSLLCALFGTIMLARLCTAAADAVRDSAPTLPTATAL